MDEPAVQVEEEESPTWEKLFCGNCPSWEKFPWSEKCDGCKETHDSERGLCRFNPPMMVPESDKGTWPVTHLDDWCGPGRTMMMEILESEEKAKAEQEAPPPPAPIINHGVRPGALALLFVVLNAVDAILTAWATHTGYGEVHEVNPLMRGLLWFGPNTFMAVKIAIGSALALYMWKRHPKSVVLWVGPLLFAGILVWNLRRLFWP